MEDMMRQIKEFFSDDEVNAWLRNKDVEVVNKITPIFHAGNGLMYIVEYQIRKTKEVQNVPKAVPVV